LDERTGQATHELDLYDQTRRRLQVALARHFLDPANFAVIVDDYAYFVCLAVNQGSTWEEALSHYVRSALRRRGSDSASHHREIAAVHRALVGAQAPVLDIGSGWGRIAPIYDQLGQKPVYVEPSSLGTRLLHRAGFQHVVCAQGESLPFSNESFPTAVIGWVLHHDPSPEVDAATLLGQAARVMIPGGLLLSIEPVRSDFPRDAWKNLLTRAGFEVERMETFFEIKTPRDEIELRVLACSRRRPV
jgi:SAM-dependent methyltransferase